MTWYGVLILCVAICIAFTAGWCFGGWLSRYLRRRMSLSWACTVNDCGFSFKTNKSSTYHEIQVYHLDLHDVEISQAQWKPGGMVTR